MCCGDGVDRGTRQGSYVCLLTFWNLSMRRELRCPVGCSVDSHLSPLFGAPYLNLALRCFHCYLKDGSPSAQTSVLQGEKGGRPRGPSSPGRKGPECRLSTNPASVQGLTLSPPVPQMLSLRFYRLNWFLSRQYPQTQTISRNSRNSTETSNRGLSFLPERC